jgi:hypothetical protein
MAIKSLVRRGRPSPAALLGPGTITAHDRYDFLYSQAFSIAAGNGTASISIKTLANNWFMLQTIQAVSTGLFRARMRDDGTGEIWQSDFVTNVNFAGLARRPNILVVPTRIPPMSQIIIDLIDVSGAPNAGEIAFGGYLYPGEAQPTGQRVDRWFQYVGRKTIGAGQTDTITIPLQSDSSFEIHKMLASFPLVGGNFSARISDSDTGKAWSDRFINYNNAFGDAQYPKMLTTPKLLRPNVVLQAEVKNLGGATTFEICLEGAKRYAVRN